MNVENGNTVCFHYVGTLDDGSEFDNSYTRGETLTGNIGEGHLIPGFESALIGMSVGEKKAFTVSPENAYGEHNPSQIHKFPPTSFPGDFVAEIGEIVQGQSQDGQVFNAKIIDANEEEVTLDFNHPLAGKNLNFEIEVVSIED